MKLTVYTIIYYSWNVWLVKKYVWLRRITNSIWKLIHGRRSRKTKIRKQIENINSKSICFNIQEQNDPRCATYVFNNEDHTLGNMLRVVLSGHSDVEFVGYSIPHPSESVMNLRLQTLTKDTN